MTDLPDNTGQKMDTRFKKGQSANPKGRPPGAKNKLGEDFVQALADDFEQNGVDAIRQTRMRNPEGYLKLVSGILPREVLVKAFGVNLNVNAEAKDFGDDTSLDEILNIIAHEAGPKVANEMAAMFGLNPPSPIIEAEAELQDLQYELEADRLSKLGFQPMQKLE